MGCRHPLISPLSAVGVFAAGLVLFLRSSEHLTEMARYGLGGFETVARDIGSEF